MHPLLSDPRFQQTLSELSEQTDQPLEVVLAQAQDCLSEMAAKPGHLSLAGWDRFCHWLSRAYKVDADDQAIEQLKSFDANNSLIFLPNHRSYLDPLILRSALRRHGFPPNYVLGGNNLAIWPLASIGQHNNIVFIRREFREAPIYRAVLREYLGYLISEHANLEWYIEGGRTRTGKLRPPRYGVLSYVIDAYANHPDHNVYLVPTSIIYDQQHEVSAISAEEMGGTKSPESIGWMYRFARSQSRRLGRAHLRFGAPLSLREAIAATETDGEIKPRLAVSKVAFEICNRINQVTPITPTALVTFALLDNDDRAITLAEGTAILNPLLDYIRVRELPITTDLNSSLADELTMSLDRLVREYVVQRYDSGTEPVFLIPRERQHEAAFYRNTIIHFFVTRAIAEIAMTQACNKNATDIPLTAWEHANDLRDLLKFEFFFPRTWEFAEAIEAEVNLIEPGWESVEFTAESALASFNLDPPIRASSAALESTLAALSSSHMPPACTRRLPCHPRTSTPSQNSPIGGSSFNLDFHLAHRVLAPFFEAYGVVADQLMAIDPARPVDQNQLVDHSFGVAQQRWLQHQLHSPESISRDLFRNALKLADNRGLLDPATTELKQRRLEFAAQIATANATIRQIRRLANEHIRGEEPEAEVSNDSGGSPALEAP